LLFQKNFIFLKDLLRLFRFIRWERLMEEEEKSRFFSICVWAVDKV